MNRMISTKTSLTAMIERLPWAVRALLGCCAACLGVGLTYAIEPLRSFPLLLAFPTVILACWFLGMWGGAFCALTEVILVNSFLTRPQLKFSVGSAPPELRLIVFLTTTLALGWAIQRLSRERAEFSIQKLEQRLMQADLERQIAEERASASETLRESEAMLQIALQANGLALWVWDFKQDVLHWSEQKYRMIGIEPGSIEPTTEAWFRAIHPDDLAGVKKTFMIARESGADYHAQYRVVWPDGSVHWLESQGQWQRDETGQVLRVVGVVADVTKRKRSEDALMRAEKLAIAGRLAASIAHEINNPLEAVSNLLFLIGMAETADAAQEHARVAMDQLMRVSMITQQTLKFHRQTGLPKAVRLSEILESVLTLFRSKMTTTDISVDVRSEHEIDILCMPSETQQVFANLVANAIDAMPRGGQLVVRLRPSRDWRDGRTPGMRVTFFDSGVGMDRVTMRRIFEPFFTTKTETGTGLGMWVVSQLVERHHGHIRVWSRQGARVSGTAFTVFLPLRETLDVSGENLERDTATVSAVS
jgi:PAS domain S-box-containing protein